MNGLEALENWYNTEQPKPVEYCFHYNIIRKELKVNLALKEKLDYNTMFRVLPHNVAKQVADYLEQNEDIKKWLKE